MPARRRPKEAPFPNRLRVMREAKHLTRVQLAALCKRLEEVDEVLYNAVGLSTIEHVERGLSRPRPSTARTVAEALGTTVEDLFPRGVDVASRKTKNS